MSNKLKWFTHDHDAHDDTWVRHLVRSQGHVAGWMWWTLLELHHKHGVGDLLTRSLTDTAKDCMTSTSVVLRVVQEMTAEFEGKIRVKARLSRDSVLCPVWTELLPQTDLSSMSGMSVLQLEIPKLRKRQSKMKSKIPSEFREDSPKIALEREGEGEREYGPTVRREESRNGTATAAGKGKKSSMQDKGQKAPERPQEPAAPATAVLASNGVGQGLPGTAFAADEPKEKRKGTALKDRKDPGSQLLWHHCQNFERVNGVLPTLNFGKDATVAKALLEDYGLDFLKRLNDRYFEAADDFVREAGYSFSIFKTRIDRLIATSKDAKTHRGKAGVSGPKLGQRVLMQETIKELIFDEWDGAKWVEKREPKKQAAEPPPSRPVVAGGEADEA